ncbi:MAG TPA: PEGA domain-containing protein [Candidatus Saccharimonadales bacterium]|nr:PEGA domain-containing protein [Candidatus Saccharimonadales bacterium]
MKTRYITALFILAAIVVAAIFVPRIGKLPVHISAVPSGSAIYVDGNHLLFTHTAYVAPGKHSFVAKFKYFDDAQKTMDVQKAENVELAPRALSDAANKYLDKNPSIKKEVQEYSEAANDRESQTTTKKYPFLSQIPYIRRTFQINYGDPVKTKDKYGAIALYITYVDQQSLNDALSWLRKNQINPTDVEVILVNDNNIFTAKVIGNPE